jgi:CheY-like chemotaxis protein
MTVHSAPRDVLQAEGRILIVDDNSIMREHLASSLRAKGAEVVTAATGEQALLRLRDWSKPIGWLYAKAALPGLIDGWILADEYHDTHPGRSAVISVGEWRPSSRDRILKNPTPTAIMETLWQAIRGEPLPGTSIVEQRNAA